MRQRIIFVTLVSEIMTNGTTLPSFGASPHSLPQGNLQGRRGKGLCNVQVHSLGFNGRRSCLPALRLLRYFAENAERVISRSELLRQVWNQPAEVQTRTVDQFVLRLRKIIEKDSANPSHLLTVRDAGYRFLLGKSP